MNRNPQSGDWHYLGKVIEAISTVHGTMQAGNIPRESTNLTLI
ncbi:MAG: hypothetical protein WA700_00430 [Acidobacteriaceae bacterium]